MGCFAGWGSYSYDAGDEGTDVTSLCDVAVSEAEADHESVENCGDLFGRGVTVERWAVGVAVAWERRCNYVEGKVIFAVFLAQQVEGVDEF